MVVVGIRNVSDEKNDIHHRIWILVKHMIQRFLTMRELTEITYNPKADHRLIALTVLFWGGSCVKGPHAIRFRAGLFQSIVWLGG